MPQLYLHPRHQGWHHLCFQVSRFGARWCGAHNVSCPNPFCCHHKWQDNQCTCPMHRCLQNKLYHITGHCNLKDPPGNWYFFIPSKCYPKYSWVWFWAKMAVNSGVLRRGYMYLRLVLRPLMIAFLKCVTTGNLYTVVCVPPTYINDAFDKIWLLLPNRQNSVQN